MNTKNPFPYIDQNKNSLDQLISHLKLAQHFFNKKHKNTSKIPITPFNYKKELKGEKIPENGKCANQVYEALSEIIEGSFKPESENALFNMIPTPITETTTASLLMQIHNNNAIMDSYGGKSILFEQKVARSIGSLIGWKKAYGISCNGGKITMFYAIKFAIQQLVQDSYENGIPNDIVILVSGGAHYSIEHTCSLVGLGSKNCIRVPIGSSNGMSAKSLEAVFTDQIQKGKRVAAIISCGGTTLDFIHENTEVVYNAMQKVVMENQLSYTPYLHLDSVIGWLWFTFINETRETIRSLTNDSLITDKLVHTLTKLSKIKKFDSVGIDFHKTGLCPYSSSFFVAKKERIVSDEKLSSKNYGEIRAFNYTLENTRSSSGIASAWTSMQIMGIKGYQKYLIALFKASKILSEAIDHTHHFKVINLASKGWEIIFTINHFKLKRWFGDNYDNKTISESFIKYVWKKIDEGEDLPLFSIIKNYGEWFGKNDGHAFIIYNMNICLSHKTARQIANDIAHQLTLFKKDITEGKTKLLIQELETPIR
ncbi:pyridoxal-dependent decarboxylase [Ascidiimonas aurantiaca]|uniref:pyridoxal-dependent decarboxylase n=1 Tax=Ascidiimonas aurantiaca TaxID=1685432 RepID=UPI0030ED5ED8